MKVVLASFDPVPAAKGASSHILRNHAILTAAGHEVSLVTLGHQPLPGIRHRVVQVEGRNWLRRAVAFREQLRPILAGGFDVVHVRSPFEGLAAPADATVIYEVNAVYSIELPCRYPALVSIDGFRERMRAAELLLLDRARAVITPSRVTAQYLGDLGVPDATVVPNCPSIPRMERSYTNGAPAKLVYIGTLSAWQGLHQALRCLSRLQHLDWTLSILTHTTKTRWVEKLVGKLELSDRVSTLPALPRRELGAFLHTCDVGLAPLTPGERNLVQGCMPVKLLDYMRAGLRIVAPDLQVVRDVVGEAPLYRAWSRQSMTEHLEASILADRRGAGELLRSRVEEHFDEAAQAKALLEVYDDL